MLETIIGFITAHPKLTIFVIALIVIHILCKKKEKKDHEKAVANAPTEEEIREAVGNDFELATARFLYDVFGYMPYHNVLLPKGNGKTEADLIMPTTKGILCVECKHIERYAIIHASFSAEKWDFAGSINRPGVTPEMRQNPLKQNAGHVEALRAVLGDDVKIFNVLMTSQPIHVNDYGKDTYCYMNYFHDEGQDYIIGLPTDPGWQVSYEHDIKYRKKALQSLPDIYTMEQVEEFGKKIEQYLPKEGELKAFRQAKRDQRERENNG